MTKISSAIFKTFFLSLCILANTHFAFAQTASILPQGYTQYLDANGKPLSSGKVYNYIPSTTTFKTTWQDAGETTANTNPVILDAAGRAKILGDGSYRQIVKDRYGNTVWDAVTSSTGSGSTPTPSTGDGDLVGTIKPWAGMTAPNQYLFTYGQEVSRTTYAELYTAITSTQAAFCNSGSPTLSGLSDTTNFWIGMDVEITCVAAGFSTVVSKTSSTVTLADNANVTTNTNAIFYPWGRGNGSTTFNLPDFRGLIPAGNNNMGGVASANLTTTYFGSTDPNSIGASGGAQSKTLIASDVPTLTSKNSSAIALSVTSTPTNIVQNTAGVISSNAGGGANGQLSGTSGTTSAVASTGSLAINAVSTISNSGGIAVSSTIAAAGSGYTNGAQTITVSGGTCTTQPQFTVTISGNAFSGTPVLLTAGSCSIPPSNPASTTGGGGTGGTLNVSYSAQPFSLIPPTLTTNYIIKVTPDSNSATASGVTSLGGMTGDIACGFGLLCTGNTISVSAIAAGGTTTQVQFNNTGALDGSSCFVWVSPALTIGLNGTCGGQLKLAGSTSGTLTQQVAAAAGTPTVTWGTSSGTPAVTATSPLQINSTTGNLSLITGTQDTILGYWGSTSVSALAINNCSNALTYDTATHTFGCNATAGTGTVTSVTAGAGLSSTVNPIVATGTLSLRAPTVQVLTSGTGATYTTPANVAYIHVKGCGGGGGGGTASSGTGGTTSFSASTMSATGGAGGDNSGGNAAGGTGTNGQINYTGGSGGGAGTGVAGNFMPRPLGGGSLIAPAAVTPGTNSCGGGAGSVLSGAGTNGGGGGGGGGFERIIASPAASYTYTIGAGGAAGTSGIAGAAGVIIVWEY